MCVVRMAPSSAYTRVARSRPSDSCSTTSTAWPGRTRRVVQSRAAVLALLVAVWWHTTIEGAAPFTRGKVVRAVDGDTIIVAAGGRTEDVRLLGIDTPETVDPRRPVGW